MFRHPPLPMPTIPHSTIFRETKSYQSFYHPYIIRRRLVSDQTDNAVIARY